MIRIMAVLMGGLLFITWATPTQASNKLVEVRETCHVRRFAPISGKLGSWKVTLCAAFYLQDRRRWKGGGDAERRGADPLRITPIQYDDNDNAIAYKVSGYQNVVGKLFPTGQFNIDITEKTIYDGFIVGPGLYTDFMYSSSIDYWWGENQDAPLDTESPCGGYEMSCGGMIHWAGGSQA